MVSIFLSPASYSTGEGYSLPENFSELFELVVRHLRADGFQPFGHKTLPQWLTDDIIWYQTQDSVQALLQLGHCGTGLVPVSSHLEQRERTLLYAIYCDARSPLTFNKSYF